MLQSIRGTARKTCTSLSLVALLCIASQLTCQSANAASLAWDWGGEEKKVKGSGRQLVRLNVDAKPGDIIVSFSDRKLYYIIKPGEAFSYPVAIPREKDRWQGMTAVSSKRENPSWTPTPTMIKENPRLPAWVPGGHPMNPLGVRALYLGDSMYRIHGTDAPWTIGTDVSKGCIRMYNADSIDLYARVKTGAKVLVTWQQYQPQQLAAGEVQASGVATGSIPQAEPPPSATKKSPARANKAEMESGDDLAPRSIAPSSPRDARYGKTYSSGYGKSQGRSQNQRTARPDAAPQAKSAPDKTKKFDAGVTEL
jgi:hypothetical protein